MQKEIRDQLAYLALGSNLGDRAAYLHQARKLIRSQFGGIEAASKIYITKAWGVKDQPDYFNQCLSIKIDLTPDELMLKLLNIESQVGRCRKQKWGRRTIDIDLLFIDQLQWQSTLVTLPHMHLHLRNFVLIPLMEIASDFIHPVFDKTIEELYLACEDTLEVLMIDQDG